MKNAAYMSLICQTRRLWTAEEEELTKRLKVEDTENLT